MRSMISNHENQANPSIALCYLLLTSTVPASSPLALVGAGVRGAIGAGVGCNANKRYNETS